MGFKDDVIRIVKQCTYSKRQTIMVSATLNQDLKELSSYALKQPLTFSVQQQQRKADLANLKLTQYLVRLKFEDVEKVPRKKKPVKEKSKKKKHLSQKKWEGSDFDSEEEYGKEQVSDNEGSYEYDDGKDHEKVVENDHADESDDEELSMLSEEGEDEMSEEGESEVEEVVK